MARKCKWPPLLLLFACVQGFTQDYLRSVSQQEFLKYQEVVFDADDSACKTPKRMDSYMLDTCMQAENVSVSNLPSEAQSVRRHCANNVLTEIAYRDAQCGNPMETSQTWFASGCKLPVYEAMRLAFAGGLEFEGCILDRSSKAARKSDTCSLRPKAFSTDTCSGEEHVLAVYSAGFHDGKAGGVFLDGQTLFNDTSRGFNVLALHPNKLVVRAHDAFDTYQDETAYVGLLKFLQKEVKEGDLLIAFINDEGQLKLHSSVKDYLAANFGADQIYRLEYRSSYILIAYKMRGNRTQQCSAAADKLHRLVGCADNVTTSAIPFASGIRTFENPVCDGEATHESHWASGACLRGDKVSNRASCGVNGTTFVETFGNADCKGEPVVNTTVEIRKSECLRSSFDGRQISSNAECVVDPRPWIFGNDPAYTYFVEEIHDHNDAKCEETAVGFQVYKLGYCTRVSSDQDVAFMVGCDGGVVTRYWYRSPSVTCRDEEIFSTEELVVGLSNGKTGKPSVCGVSPQGFVGESYCTDTIPQMEDRTSLRLYRDAQCTEFYYSETYEDSTCFEYSDGVVLSTTCTADDSQLAVFSDVSVDGTCNQTSSSGKTTSYTANKCTLLPWGKQVAGRPAAGWYLAPCGTPEDDDGEGDGTGGNDDNNGGGGGGGSGGANAANTIVASRLATTAMLLWAGIAMVRRFGN